ncbi:MAG: hypothetical protein HQ521_02610 [Bacteroidetes bacterium]|nr:hypothetical protein [Bacteroidota bacterium]
MKNSFENRTGTTCSQSGTYMCKLHPAIDEVVIKGNHFPRCRQGAGHDTNWILMG